MEKVVSSQERSKNSLSPRKTLEKTMTLKDYVSLALGTMIGIAWVIFTGLWLTRGGPLGAMLGFILCGLLLIPVGKCYAELTPAIPVAGGGIAFAYRAFGTGASFLIAWFLAFCYIIVCPYILVAIGWLFEYVISGAKSQTLYTVGGYSLSPVSILTGVFFGLFIIILNYLGVKSSARFQTISTGLMFICAITFILVAIIKGSFSNMIPLFAGGGTIWSAVKSTIAVLAIVPWFMAGFDTIPQAAEESGKKINPKDLGKAVIISIVVGFMFYALVLMAVSLCLPWQETIKLEMPTADAFQVAFGYKWVTYLVLFAALLGLITTINGVFLAGSRVVFSAGRGALLPRWFGEVDKKYHTPKNAILFVGMITLIGPFVGRSSLLPIINVGSLAFVSAWLITCLAAINLRKTAPQMNRPYRVKNKFTFYLGAMVSAILILSLIMPKSPSQLKWPIEYIIVGAWMFLGYVGYRWRQKKKDLSKEERDYQILGDYR